MNTKKNLIYSYVERGWTIILSLIMAPFYLSNAGSEMYGLLGIYTSLTTLLSVLDLGLGGTINRRFAASVGLKDANLVMANYMKAFEFAYALVALLAVAILSSAIYFFSDNWITPTNNYSAETIKKLLWLLTSAVFFQWMGSLYSSALNGMHRQALIERIKIVQITLQHAGAYLLLKFSPFGLLGFFSWQVILAIIASLVYGVTIWNILGVSVKKWLQLRVTINELLVDARYSAGISIISLQTLVLSQLDKILLSRFLPLDAFGYYMFASNLAQNLTALAAPVYTNYQPRLVSAMTKSWQNVKLEYQKATQLVAIIVVPIAITLSVYAHELLGVWLKKFENVQNTWEIFSILLLGVCVNVLMSMPYGLMLAAGWVKLVIYQNIIAIIVLVPGLYYATKNFAGLGAAYIWLILNISYVLVLIPIMHRKILQSELQTWYEKSFIAPILICASISIATKMLMPSTSNSLMVIIQIGVAYLLSCFMTLLYLSDLRQDILRILKLNKP
jgi:O-antigen/teichoic acid export membrane protein